MTSTTLDGRKPWYRSKTIWGSVIAIAASVLGVWDVRISPDEQARLAELIVQALGALGGLIALIGRFSASRRIG